MSKTPSPIRLITEADVERFLLTGRLVATGSYESQA